MYVCVCNALSDADVETAEKSGATEELEVFSHHGVKPQCGRCLSFMKGLLEGLQERGKSSAGCPCKPPGTKG